MRDNANGRLGIGIFTPTEVLDVNDTGKFTSVQIGDTMSLLSSSSYGVIQSETGLAFNTSGSSTGKMVIDTAGNVGIGTNTPNTKLDVNGNAIIQGDAGIGTGILSNYGLNVYGSIMAGGVGGSTQRGDIHTNNGFFETYIGKRKDEDGGGLGTSSNYGIIVHDILGYGVGLRVIMDSPNGTAATFMGNVGIGTDDPQAKLEVNGLLKVGSYDISVASPCSGSSTEGAIFYDSTVHYHCACDYGANTAHALHDVNKQCR